MQGRLDKSTDTPKQVGLALAIMWRGVGDRGFQ